MNAFKIHKESPAITLIGRGEYAEDIPHDRRIFWHELKNCNVGDKWSSYGGNKHKAHTEEEMTAIYKDKKGVACLLRTIWTDDAKYHEDLEILWFEFGNHLIAQAVKEGRIK